MSDKSKKSVSSQENHSKTVESVSERILGIIYRIDLLKKNQIHFLNKMLPSLTGYKPDELNPGKHTPLENIIHPEDKSRVIKIIKKSIKNAESYEIDYRIKKKNGSVMHFLERGNPRKKDKDKVAYIDGIIIDITERKTAEQNYMDNLFILENLERINSIISRTEDPEKILEEVFIEVKNMFHVDRTWLLFPCDPDSKKMKVQVEVTDKQFPGAFEKNQEMDITPEFAGIMKKLLKSDFPLSFSSMGKLKVPKGLESFQVRAQLITALSPREGKPWILGMHQCASERTWTEVEVALFDKIADRIADLLSNILYLRELRASEEKYRELADSIQQGVAILTREAPVYVNRRLAEITGYSEKEILTWTIDDLMEKVHEDDRDKVKEQFAKKIKGSAGAEKTYNFRWKSTNGETHWFQLSSTQIVYEDQPAIHAVLVDISNLKETEAALRESEELYRNLYESAIVAMFRTDIKEGKILKSNQAHAELLGYKNEKELLDKNVKTSSFLSTEELTRYLIELRKNGLVSNFEVLAHLPSGEDKYLAISSKIFADKGFVEGAAIDITDLKKTEEALKESQEKYRSLYYDSREAFMMVDIEEGFLDANNATLELFGCRNTREFTSGSPMGFSPEVQPDGRPSAEKAIEMMKTAMKNGVHFFDWRHKRMDGSEFDATVLLSRVQVGDKVHMTATVRDVTERKESEERLNLAFASIDCSSDSIFWFDDKAEILYVNDAACHSLAYTKDELLSLSIPDIDPSFSMNRWPTHRKYLRQNGFLILESEQRRKDGVFIPVEININYFNYEDTEYYFAFVRDISARKIAEQRIQENEEKFSKAFKSSPVLMTISTLDTGVFLEVNDTFLDVTGYSREEVIGKSSKNLNLYADREQRDAILHEIIEKGDSRDNEVEIRTKDGKRRIGVFSADKITIKDQEYLLAVMNDITQRVLVERELEKYKNQLEALVETRTQELEQTQKELVTKERLAALGQLIATVSHEIRNPLSTVRTAVYSIGQALEKNESGKIGRVLELAERSIVRCDTIINDLLDFARKKKLSFRKVSIDKWLKDTVEEFDFPEDIKISTTFKSNAYSMVDTSHLRRVIINLIDNAVHSVSDKPGRAGGSVSISTAKQDKNVEIVIEDNGGGIKDEDLDKIFEPLFSTKSFGIGLGLSIVKQLVEQHEGDIRIESEEGKGTKFKIVLPSV